MTDKSETDVYNSPFRMAIKKKKSLSNKFWQVCGEKERKFFLIGM